MPAPASVATPRPALLAGAFALMTLIWGSTWFVIKEGAADLPPFTGAAARFVLAWVLMALVARPLARREGGARPTLDLVLVTGGLQFGASYAIVYWSEMTLSSGVTAVLWAAYPLLLAAVSVVMLPGERLVARQWCGLLLGFVGIGVLMWTDLRSAGPAHVTAGAVLLLSPLVVAIANAYVRGRATRVSAVLLTRDGLLVGAVILVAVALLTERDAAPRWSGPAVLSVAYLAAMGTCLAFTLYFWSMRHMRASTLALMTYLTPVVALTLGALLGGERYSAFTALGTAVVLGGVALARRPRG